MNQIKKIQVKQGKKWVDYDPGIEIAHENRQESLLHFAKSDSASKGKVIGIFNSQIQGYPDSIFVDGKEYLLHAAPRKTETQDDEASAQPDYDGGDERTRNEDECPACQHTEHSTLGRLGRLTHYRCRACGSTWYYDPK